MPRPALTEEQRRDIRQNIRKAAAKLYTQDGLSAISARAVAKEAGVSVGTLYAHFDNLSELLQSLWRQPLRRLVAELETIVHADSTPAENLTRLLERYANFAFEEPLLYRSAFLFVRPESVAPPEKVPLAEDRFFQLFRRVIDEGQKDGSFRAGDANELTQIVISCIHGVIALPVNMHRLELDNSPGIVFKTIEAQLEWLQG